MTRHFTVMIALAGAVLAFDPAHASSIDPCRGELEALHEAIPSGITGVWVEIVQEEIAKIDAMTDEASLNAGIDALQAEYEAYQANPDPDGDGSAMAPQIVEAQTVLSVCLYKARAAELGTRVDGGDEADDVDETEGPGAAQAQVEEEDRRSPPRPTSSPGGWFANAVYPVTALREERSGSVRYEVTVAADGSVAGCQASGPPGSADLELATCDVFLNYGRFSAATDRAGRPVVGEFTGTMRWSLP